MQAVRTVADGNALLSPAVTKRLIAEFTIGARAGAARQRLEALTEREREVVVAAPAAERVPA